jgi:response regulator RpfG family c-di-GMP phosphodiesterase
MNKILMVNEEVSIVEKALERLSHAGFEMLSAYDGRHGFQIAKDKVPDLIITDATVPVMSGYELCKAIKLDQDTRSIPIIVMTEKHRMEDSFMFLGVKDFLNKPVSMDELESLVRLKLNFTHTMHLQKSKILIYGRPEILSCCQQLLKSDPQWSGYFSNNNDSFLENAIKYAPDVIFMDLLAPGVPTDEMIKKISLISELKNTVILTYYTTASVSQDTITIQARMIEVQYMKMLTQEAGAKEYLGAFNPVTFMSLINIYRKDFEA